MNTFIDAVNSVPGKTTTTNMMATYDTSLNPVLDLFFAIGASRGKDITALFNRAWQTDKDLTLRCMLWARDVRKGSGERQTFRNLLRQLAIIEPQVVQVLLPKVPELGRWDDLLVLPEPHIGYAAKFILNAIKNGDGLAAKWMPRKGPMAVYLRKAWEMTPKQYRKFLVRNTKVVETDMCSNEWSNINYNHVPSVASARYQNAFNRHDEDRYQLWKDGLNKGTSKVNAGAVYPYDVVRSLKIGDKEVALAQWENLPNYLSDNLILPMVHVSGSMTCPVSGSVTALDIAVSIGLYLADKQQGPFKDLWLTFSAEPQLERLTGNLVQKYHQMVTGKWQMNTDLELAFDRILDVAKQGQVKAEDMPKYLLILSDMEFDQCRQDYSAYGYLSTTPTTTAWDMIQGKYERAGYQIPKVIFWNLNARPGNVPVSQNEEGVALVSGFNTHILKSILSASNLDPVEIMKNTLMSSRYNIDWDLVA